jgi:hypothetical protein
MELEFPRSRGAQGSKAPVNRWRTPPPFYAKADALKAPARELRLQIETKEPRLKRKK